MHHYPGSNSAVSMQVLAKEKHLPAVAVQTMTLKQKKDLLNNDAKNKAKKKAKPVEEAHRYFFSTQTQEESDAWTSEIAMTLAQGTLPSKMEADLARIGAKRAAK